MKMALMSLQCPSALAIFKSTKAVAASNHSSCLAVLDLLQNGKEPTAAGIGRRWRFFIMGGACV
jgi:hypothetical protein